MFGAMRRLLPSLAMLNPTNLRSSGRATALFASLAFSRSLLVCTSRRARCASVNSLRRGRGRIHAIAVVFNFVKRLVALRRGVDPTESAAGRPIALYVRGIMDDDCWIAYPFFRRLDAAAGCG